MTPKAWLAMLAVTVLAGCVTVSEKSVAVPTSSTAEPTSGRVGAGEESEARRRARIRTELAMSYYTKGQMQVALEELRNATQADPSYAPAYNAFGLVYLALNERSLAEDNFKQALSLAPADAEINNNYGWFLCQTGRPAQAMPYFQTALRDALYATPAIAARSAGICAMQQRDYAAAQEYLQRSFQSDPANATTMYYLADVLYRRGEYERARFYAQRLNRQIEVTAQTLWLELRIEHKLGDRDAEALLVSQLKRRFPDSREYDAWRRGAFDE